MSNDGSATPGPGEQPDGSDRPAPETSADGSAAPAAPAPSGHEAAPGAGPAPSGFEVPQVQPDPAPSEWPTAPFGTRVAGDQPTAAYGTPSADQPTSPYGAPPVPGASGGYPAPGAYGAQPTTPYGTPAASTGDQPGATGYPAAPGYPVDNQAGSPYATPGYPQAGQPGAQSQAGQPQGGYAGYPGGGYPPAGGGPYPYSAAPYPGPSATSTDGVSIAALVTSLLGMNVVAVVLGIVGLRRTKKNGTQGRGLALAGLIIGALELVALVVIGIAITAAVVSHNNQVDSLRDDCASGVMQACDDLYYDSPVGSDDEEFGRTCGGRTDGATSCTLLDEEGATEEGAVTGGSYGDDPELDALWDACEAGSGTACDDLYSYSPGGSEYEEFGLTCGDRVEAAIFCSDEIGD